MPYSKNRYAQGFTLMEIIIVVIIVGVLAGLTIPRFGGTIERVRASEGVSILTTFLSAQEAYRFETGAYATLTTQLDVTPGASANFAAPTVGAGPIATVIRNGGGYTLNISATGIITCVDGASITCARAGY